MLVQGSNRDGCWHCCGNAVGPMTTEADDVLCRDASLDADLVWPAAAAAEIDGDCPC